MDMSIRKTEHEYIETGICTLSNKIEIKLFVFMFLLIDNFDLY